MNQGKGNKVQQYGARNLSAYRKTEVQTAGRLDVLVMLYDGAIRFMNQAKGHIQANEIAEKGKYIGKAMAIISEFKNTLNYEQAPELAGNLDRLYDFIQDRLQAANIKNDVTPLDEAVKITETLREGWKELQKRQRAGNLENNDETKKSQSNNYFRISV